MSAFSTFDSIDSALDWLYSLQHFGIKLGIQQTQKMLDHFDLLNHPFKYIHIAGTNGKGSTSTLLSQMICHHANQPCGLFTSPHLIQYNERIQINHQQIDPTSLLNLINHVYPYTQTQEHPPTFFELSLLLALLWFRENHISWVILETGMGGRLDATNFIQKPQATVITSIGLDHTEYLGETLSQIAKEKAGIIKNSTPLFLGHLPQEAQQVIADIALQHQAPIHSLPKNLPNDSYLQHNLLLAHSAFTHLFPDLPPLNSTQLNSLLTQLSSYLPARFQTLPNHQPALTIDGAHNPQAIQSLIELWNQQYPNQKPFLILGLSSGKDHQQILTQISAITDTIILCHFQSPRAIDPKSLIHQAKIISPTTHWQTAANVKEALTLAQQQHQPILLTGSLFFAGEALSHFNSNITYQKSLQ
jgi:dihydrofolate synthase/folylpolyglutamate synthase